MVGGKQSWGARPSRTQVLYGALCSARRRFMHESLARLHDFTQLLDVFTHFIALPCDLLSRSITHMSRKPRTDIQNHNMLGGIHEGSAVSGHLLSTCFVYVPKEMILRLHHLDPLQELRTACVLIAANSVKYTKWGTMCYKNVQITRHCCPLIVCIEISSQLKRATEFGSVW